MNVVVAATGLDTLTVRLAGTAAALRTYGASRVTVGTNVAYAKIVHDGSRAHIILPRAKKALFWPGAKHPVRLVRHPGTRANPYLTDALRAQRAAAVAALQAAVVAVARGAPAGELRAGFRRAGLAVQRDAQGRVKLRTGNLRRSLHTEVVVR